MKVTIAISGKIRPTLKGSRAWKNYEGFYSDMIQLPKDFKELLRLLNSKSIEYLVIAGYAVALHGYPRATKEIKF